MKIIYCTRFSPTADGHGGNHRSYQVYADLVKSFGKDNVIILSYSEWLEENKNKPYHSISLKRRIILNKYYRLFENIQKNPYRLLWKNKTYHENRYSYPDFISTYEEQLSSTQGKVLCIVDDPGFSKVINLNQSQDIPTICMMHDFESFDYSPLYKDMDVKIRNSVFMDFVNEVDIYSKCDLSLSISKVEAGFLSGLGLPASHYPYYPVGDIRERLLAIRSRRAKESQNLRQILVLGGSSHPPTGIGMQWFLQNLATDYPLDNVQFIFAGHGTDKFTKTYGSISFAEFKGYISESDLADLLTRVNAVLVLNHTGFGSITRVPDMACAGVPVICTKHVSFAQNLPPGAEAVELNWEAWQQAIQKHSESKSMSSNLSDYETWEEQQIFPLQKIVENLSFNHSKARD